ncbi:hypothetical protein FOA52_010590 [Chlamydomonas sp. UWO 241]|nr:hypothetical protein FOA52_010590 [Chlamydomonas sp. UWO 241]
MSTPAPQLLSGSGAASNETATGLAAPSERRDQRRRMNTEIEPAQTVGKNTLRTRDTPTKPRQADSRPSPVQLPPTASGPSPRNSDGGGIPPPRTSNSGTVDVDGSVPTTPRTAQGRSGSGYRPTPRRRGAVGRSRAGSAGGSEKGRASVADLPLAGQQPGRAHVHLFGEVSGGDGFEADALYCKWQLVYDSSRTWELMRGTDRGTTHVCSNPVPEDDYVVWEHPFDLQLSSQTVQGWPSIVMMVYSQDSISGRDQFVAYGTLALPKSPGVHQLSVSTWFVVETQRARQRRIFGWFTGMNPRLKDESFVLDAAKRDNAGPFVSSVGAGVVHVRLNVAIKDQHHLTYLSGESLFAALEKVRYALERKNHKDIVRISHIRDDDSEEDVAKPVESEGVRRMREGREARLASARASLDARFAADRGQMITVSAYSPTEAASDEEAGDFYLRVAALADKAIDKRDLLIVAG